ncbi:GNAT family N-acetyltransferase [Chryseobacterium sp. YIM B08800]|uniref:GNAT family N-acetyltransferase n=1 Tax=Chryseobacterium sp. YIM B08800 TaxID=2984136 RepID=UPI0022405C5A|nr:GNAT family N-acetyltransferase [Chryseobacterium sp. YIM B08800]
MEIEISSSMHLMYVSEIQQEMYDSAQRRGTGIAKRSIEYLSKKISEGNAVVATENGEWVGFCYIETWSHGQFVANSGLIVSPKFRHGGIATLIKDRVFALSREKFPNAKIFGLTTGLAVMKINSDLGYKPVIYSELTQDEEFWNGCKNCVNYEILMKKERKNCLCTAMLFVPDDNKVNKVVNNQPKNQYQNEQESNLSV